MSNNCIVDLTVRGTLYKVTCSEDSVHDLVRLANKFGKSVSEVALDKYHGSEASLFLIAALRLEEKIEELTIENNSLKEQIQENMILIKEKERLEQFIEDSKVYLISRIEKIVKYIEDKMQA